MFQVPANRYFNLEGQIVLKMEIIKLVMGALLQIGSRAEERAQIGAGLTVQERERRSEQALMIDATIHNFIKLGYTSCNKIYAYYHLNI